MAFNYGNYPYGNQYGFQQYQPNVQPNYQFNQPVQDQRVQQNGDARIWVQGEVGAKAYLVAPNNTVALWDSESQVIYLKTVMPNGVPSMTKLAYSVENATPAPIAAPDYITRTEFEKRIAELSKTEVKNDE